MNVPMQPMPTEYKLVRSNDGAEFEKTVNKVLHEGWMLHGPTVQADNGGFFQPMVMLEIRPVKMGKMDGDIMPVSGIIRQ